MRRINSNYFLITILVFVFQFLLFVPQASADTYTGGLLELQDAIVDDTYDSVFNQDVAITLEDNLGSISTTGTMTINGGNYNIYGRNDGALYSGLSVSQGQTLNIKNVGLYENGAVVTSWNEQVSDFGGVVNNQGTLAITDSVFYNNSATNSGGVVYSEVSISGSCVNVHYNPLTISGSTFDSNRASSDGGAIYNYLCNAETVTGLANTFEIKNSAFIGNSSEAASGGAIYNSFSDSGSNSNSTFTISGSTFDSNHSVLNGGGAVYNYVENYGSGNVNNFSVQSSVFTGNYTQNDHGGAIFNSLYNYETFVNSTNLFEITDTTFTGNYSIEGNHGAVSNYIENYAENSNSSFKISGSTFEQNYADSEAGAIGNYFGNYAAGTNSTSTFEITGTTFTGNHTTYELGDGGAIYNVFENYADNLSSNFIISGSTFNSNHSGADGGAIYSYFENYQTGTNSTNKFEIADTTFTGNYSENGLGGAIYADFENYGRSLSSSFKISGSTFDSNHAYNGGGAIYNYLYAYPTSGNSTNTFEVTGTKFIGNSSEYGDGGAICSCSYDDGFANVNTFTVINSEFKNNAANNGRGGAIYNNGGTLNIIANGANTTFSGNTDSTGANDIYFQDSTLNLNASAGNSITLGGGISSNNQNANINLTGTGIVGEPPIGAPTEGTVNIGGVVSQTNLNLYGGTLNLANGVIVSNSTLNYYDGILNFASGGSFIDSSLNVNAGILNLAQDSNITGISLYVQGGTLQLEHGIDLSSTGVQLYSGVLSLENGRADDVLSINDFYADEAASIKFDADLASGTNDYIVANSASGTLNVSHVNLIGDGDIGTLKLFDNEISPELVKFIAFTNDYRYQFNPSSTAGIYDVTRIEIQTSGLHWAIEDDAPYRSFSANADFNVLYELGPMQGDNSTLDINGNGYSINGNGFSGISVAQGQTLNIDKVGSLNEDGTVKTSWKDHVSQSGGVVNNQGTLTVTDSVFYNNTATSQGGVISADMSNSSDSLNNSLVVSGSTFDSNHASNEGGVIYNFSDNYDDVANAINSFAILGTIFTENYSEEASGGVIYIDASPADNSNSSFTISDSTFSLNHASYDGGAIVNKIYNRGIDSSNTFSIADTTFIGNYSVNGSGGAIYADISTKRDDFTNSLVFSGSTFDSNHSYYDGGAVYNNIHNAGANSTNTFAITDTTFTDNYSENGNGGAIYNYVSDSGSDNVNTFTVKNSTFTGNHADYAGNGCRGGAIYNYGGTLNIIADGADTTFTGNTDSTGDNDIYFDNATLNLNASSNNSVTFGGGIASSDISNNININMLSSGGATEPPIGAPTTGIINFNGVVSNSTINLYDGTLKLSSGSVIDSTNLNNLNLNGGVLDLQNGSADDVVTINDFYAEESASIKFDADLSATPSNDKFFVSGTATGTVNVFAGTGLNIIEDSSSDEGTLVLFEGWDLWALNLADFVAYTTNYEYVFTGGLTNGIYSYVQHQGGPIGLNTAVTKGADFSATADTTVTGNLGVIGGDGSMTINGNYYNINGTAAGTSYSGISVASGRTLNVNNVGSLNSDSTVKTSFNGFSSTNGGVINNGGTTTIKDSVFASNTASGLGGAIYNTGTLNVEASAGGKTLFTQNRDSSGANAIHLASGTMNLNAGAGGSITFKDKITSASADNQININSNVNPELTTGSVNINSAISDAKVNISAGTTNLNNASVYDNVAFNITGGQQNFTNVSLKNNSKIAIGGAGTVTNISGTRFSGADYTLISPVISVGAGTLNLANSSFTGFTTATNGGAIAATSGIVNVANTSFTNNSATGLGGAIYNNGAVVNVSANGANVAFTNNTDSNGNAVYLESGTLNLNTAGGSSITFNDKIASNNINNQININSPTVNSALTSGNVAFNNAVSNSTISMYSGIISLGNDTYLNGNNLSLNGGTVNMLNGSTGAMNVNNLSLAGTTNLAIDADLAAGLSDRITSDHAVTGSGMLNINQINLLSQTPTAADMIIADANVRNHVQLGVSTIQTPLYNYNLSYNAGSGSMSVANAGFTPSAVAPPVASSAGTLLTQTASYNEAFSNMDSLMFMPAMDRLLMRSQAKTAAADENFVFSPLMLQEQNKGMWFKQFTTFENVPLNNGPRVSNVGYGMLFGGDSELKYLGKGYTGYMSLYAGYNGSHQNYDNVGSYQNGGLIGLTGTVYKGKFFAAMTVNTGASCGTNNTTSGVDNFTTIMAGAALKAGYNFEFNGGKFIVQPSLTTSYTFANTFDYTTSSGLNVTSDPLNAIQISPGIKFIGNLSNGWQPYVGVNMVFNAMDSSRFYANNVQLPQLTVAPYVEYGVGVQRRWGDRFTGFGQAMARGGGRNGVALQFGFRWAFGKDPAKKQSQPLPKNVS